ncbi:alpha/beta hydrolase [Arthrobacter cryoconiti]|uniref:Alpha/beta hydrolase n=1 Tax=Arthrobacter cryoconiti TaxID=748907 RepID=A0ABV8QVD2_9MICC|nr:alpha/beta hydrolase [Arthrobacter cryoconiti]MCC9069509.1 alpha/beta hydrolase [Arthrobacter cryoconiti]
MSKREPTWHPDILGPGYEATTLNVPRPDGSPRQATLVRHCPLADRKLTHEAAVVNGNGKPLPARGDPAENHDATVLPPVLYIHGWSDYFYNTGLAEYFSSRGHPFYALDLHNHGRNLADPSMGGYVDDLADYDAELLAAYDVLNLDAAKTTSSASTGSIRILLIGHSTGGLIAALWAHKYPELVGQLVLNSPWLELQGGAAIRRAATPLLGPFAQRRPLTRMRVPERTFYWRGISDEAFGDWSVDRALRPPQAFPVRAGWMRAILAAQRQVASGLALPMPVLVLLSSRSMLGPVWTLDMLSSDVVLDVRVLAHRSLSLGDSVSVERIDGALHEVFLSTQTVRELAYDRLERWLRGYVD